MQYKQMTVERLWELRARFSHERETKHCQSKDYKKLSSRIERIKKEIAIR